MCGTCPRSDQGVTWSLGYPICCTLWAVQSTFKQRPGQLSNTLKVLYQVCEAHHQEQHCTTMARVCTVCSQYTLLQTAEYCSSLLARTRTHTDTFNSQSQAHDVFIIYTVTTLHTAYISCTKVCYCTALTPSGLELLISTHTKAPWYELYVVCRCDWPLLMLEWTCAWIQKGCDRMTQALSSC